MGIKSENHDMKEIPMQELKVILFEILKSIDACCRKNQINYSLTYGTLLGAVRHKGYIPWDDDIDVMMSRNDYERFLSLYKNDACDVMTSKPGIDWWPCFTRICAKNTAVIFDGLDESEHGVWVAVIPVDKVPNDCWEMDKYRYKLKWYWDVIVFKKCMFIHSPNRIKEYVKKIVRIFLNPISTYGLELKAEKIKSGYRNTSTSKVSMLNEGAKHTIFPSYCMENYIELEFEGQKFMCIKEYDVFLKIEYGNYMEFPPEIERVPAHNFKAYYI